MHKTVGNWKLSSISQCAIVKGSASWWKVLKQVMILCFHFWATITSNSLPSATGLLSCLSCF